MNKVIVWASRIISVACIVYPLIYLVNKFSNEKVIEATTKTVLPIPILIVVSVIGMVLIVGVSTQLFIVYFSKAKSNPFSFTVIAPFGLIILGITWFAKLWINKISLLIEVNAERFMNDLSTYAYSMNVVMIWVGIGIGIGLAGVIYNYIEQNKA